MRRVELDSVEGIRFVPEAHSGDGVLVLAGSSGRIDVDRARVFANYGCVAESIRWFGGPGQHSTPWEIPMETFLDRVADLAGNCDRVWIVGTSFGSEAAMLCGALSERVTGVIAFAPSDVVWGGYDDSGRETSHWTYDNRVWPFVPFDWTGYMRESPARLRPLYEQSRRTFADRVSAASIPVERIDHLVLVAGGDDQVWPSATHAERIRSLRAGAGLVTHMVTTADAGHRAILPGEQAVTGGAAILRGGTQEADRRLGARAWQAITSLLYSVR